jgi:hypothetical protein
VPVWEQGVFCAEEVIEQHPEGIDRRDGWIEELILLIWEIISI